MKLDVTDVGSSDGDADDTGGDADDNCSSLCGGGVMQLPVEFKPNQMLPLFPLANTCMLLSQYRLVPGICSSANSQFEQKMISINQHSWPLGRVALMLYKFPL